MKILLIDNYDSFTFNLYQNIGELLDSRQASFTIDVIRNDAITLKEIKKRRYGKIILSPGPGDPSEKAYFGVCADVLTEITTTPILGVCLGMQGMAHYFGGKVTKAEKLMHGKTSTIAHNNKGIFKGIPQKVSVMRYHSLVVKKSSLPECLEITALSDFSHDVMGLRHKTLPIQGVQFHPESFVTEAGKMILENFLYS